MRIGVISGARREMSDLHAVVQEVAQAEADGFDSFWFPQISTGGFDALTVISLAGAQTSRISLGTGVIPTYPIHPLPLAKHALTAQVATGGRLTLGIGLSHKPTIEDTMGLSYTSPARHMSEYLTVLRALVNEGKVDFAGQFFNVSAELQVPGATPFPVVIAALAPRMLGVAGEQADGTITWMTGMRTIESHVSPRIRAAAQNAGTSQPRVCVGMPVAVTGDTNGTRQRAAQIYQRYGQLTNYRRMLDLEGVEGPSEVVVMGDEAAVEKQLRAYADAGATEFIASIFPGDSDESASIACTWDLLKGLVGKI
jgi:F420-dependent oxidoreductase-like protein